MPSEPLLGEIYLSGLNFAPRGYAFCAGQLLSIAQNTALFALLGTNFGGNGQTTFALPDLRGRVPIGAGQGPGLSPRTLGELAGEENHTLISTEMPAHNHLVNAKSDAGDASAPAGAFLANTGALDKEYKNTDGPTVQMSPQMIGLAGGSQPHNNMQPYLVLNYNIALEGIFPSRN